MTHGLFERAYRRWKSSPRAEKEAEKSIWEAARRPSQFHQPIAPLVESDDPRYSAKSDSEYKISFLLGGEEAIAPASPRLRYTLVPRDDQDSPSNTSRSSPAIDRPRRFLHKGSRAHRQSRHGSKERMHSRGLRRGPFSAKFETLIKRKPPVSFTNIDHSSLRREPRQTGHSSSTPHEDIIIHTQRTITQMHDTLDPEQQSQIMYSSAQDMSEHICEVEAFTEDQEKQRPRQAASPGQLQRRQQRSSVYSPHVSFVDAEDEESSITTSQDTIFKHDVAATMPDSYPFSMRYTTRSGSEQGREETWKDSFQGLPRLPQRLPPICPPPVVPKENPEHQNHPDFKAHFLRLRDRTDPIGETPNLFTETSKCLQHLPEDVQKVYAKQVWPSKSYTNAEPARHKYDHTNPGGEHPTDMPMSKRNSTEHDHPTPPPPLFHHEHTTFDDDQAGGSPIIQRTYTNLNYASKIRERQREAAGTTSRGPKIMDVPLKKLRKVYRNGALRRSYTQAGSEP